jgi:hypothetical protein
MEENSLNRILGEFSKIFNGRLFVCQLGSMIFLAAIAALYVTMSVGWSVSQSVCLNLDRMILWKEYNA